MIHLLTEVEKQKAVKKYKIEVSALLVILWALSLWGIVAISKILPESVQGLFVLGTWIFLMFYSGCLLGKTTNRYSEMLELEELKNTYEKCSRMYINRLKDLEGEFEETYKEYLSELNNAPKEG